MSTRSTLYEIGGGIRNDKHELQIHIYEEMHDDNVHMELSCTTCNTLINVMIPKHLGEQLAEKLKTNDRSS